MNNLICIFAERKKLCRLIFECRDKESFKSSLGLTRSYILGRPNVALSAQVTSSPAEDL